MKNIMYLCAILLTTTAFAQEKNNEAKEETEVKIVKIKDGEKTTEKKVKVVTRETAQVVLDDKDKNKVNQDRVNSVSKVEKMVMVDDDGDDNYELLTKKTFYKIGDKDYLFKPNDRGFDIAFNSEENKFIKTSSAFNTTNGNYLIDHENYAGIGYFNPNGDFVIQYYDKNTDKIVTKTYTISATSL
ncbi:hypothetical protein PK35_07825 [Tamlana nanhaiensis]|uniref:Uncharacterized protein n=1 Tax=Neotamlana nanhaiensis TaxID=1382798 RepID=A0A0D7W2F0_9FLAO|nr:hypothetical protein [Tamlana nanhaiensis]KJD32878.1 hypothetical protein PK35_07825 [Tamlana nanhaiensis]